MARRPPAFRRRSSITPRRIAFRTFDPLLVGGRVYPVWLSDSVRFYYEMTGAGADRGTLYLVDPRARTRRPLFDNVRIAASLSAIADTSIDSHTLPARKLVNGERAMQFDVRGKSYWCPLDSERCVLADSAQIIAQAKADGPTWASRSPDGQWDAFVWNYNVYVRPARATDADPDAWRARPRAPVRNGCDAPTMVGPLPPRDSVSLPAGSIALTTDGTTSWGFGLYRFGLEVARVELDRFTLTTGRRALVPGLEEAARSTRRPSRRADLSAVLIQQQSAGGP